MTAGITSYLKRHRHAYFIALMGFMVSLGLFYALQIQEERYILSIAQLGIETIDSHIQSELAFDAHLLHHVSAHVAKLNPKNSLPKSDIDDLLTRHPQFLAVAYVYDNKINWIQASNQAVDYHPFVDKLLIDYAHAINTNMSPWVSDPVILDANHSAFFIILPQDSQHPDSGSFLALIDANSLVHQNAELPGMVFEIYLNHQALIPYASNKNQQWLLEIGKNAYGALWEIKAQEATINLGIIHLISKEAPLSWITFFLGILISILLARSTDLSDLLKQRTQVLDKINQDLKDEINNHIETEASKKTLEKALLQGQKLQAIGTLAGGIAHDFNNLLYAIRGYVELARDEIPQDGITFKNLGRVLEATYRGQDLISQILTFSRRQHHEFFPLNLNKEISGALSLLRPTVPQTVDIDFQSSADGEIMGNKTQIHQIIVNLINNAVDAMDGEGKIEIRLGEIEGADIQGLKNPHSKLNKYCKIEISDTGHGMDQSTMDRIFEPFYTTKEVGKGTGLGLSTVHSIVKDHLGEILVNSQVGKGSTFTLFFPERTPSTEDDKNGQNIIG